MIAVPGKRIKRVEPKAPQSREDMEALVGEIAALTIERDAMTVELDGRLQAIRAEYEARLAETALHIESKLAAAQLWAAANPAAFGSKKSIEMVHAVVGFRVGMPRLKTLRGCTWSFVLEQLARFRLQQYIRCKSEPDKERIIADREKLAERLDALGVVVVQDETFFVEPKREVQEQNP